MKDYDGYRWEGKEIDNGMFREARWLATRLKKKMTQRIRIF